MFSAREMYKEVDRSLKCIFQTFVITIFARKYFVVFLLLAEISLLIFAVASEGRNTKKKKTTVNF